MPSTRQFLLLKRRLEKLRKNFLPKRFSPTGVYSDRQQDLAKAYRLLTHAEIEAYIEDIAKKTLQDKIRVWKDNKKASDLIICMLSFYHEELTDKELAQLPKPIKAEDTVDKAVKQLMGKIISNNGINQADVKKMILPLGVRSQDLDDQWLIQLDNFGRLRGDVAHNSGTTISTINPEDEYKFIQALLIGLEKLDQLVTNLK